MKKLLFATFVGAILILPATSSQAAVVKSGSQCNTQANCITISSNCPTNNGGSNNCIINGSNVASISDILNSCNNANGNTNNNCNATNANKTSLNKKTKKARLSKNNKAMASILKAAMKNSTCTVNR